MRRPLLFVVLAIQCLSQLSNASQASAQSYISAVGNPSFGVNVPVPNGYINVTNGNLHLEVPLATQKQRGALQLNERLIYDSRIWEIVHYSGYYWWPINVPNSSAGWRFVKGNEAGTVGTSATQIQSTSCWNGQYDQPYQITTTYYNWTDPNGTVHAFQAGSTSYTLPYNCPGGQSGGSVTNAWNGWATDASGYYATATVGTYGSVAVTIKDNSGNQVYPQVIDRFGNFWSNDSNGNLIDDLGRTPVITTVNGNLTYYDVLAPNGPISNNGTRVRYTVTTEQVTIITNFNQSGVTEYQNNGTHSATIPAIQSIGLPDGSSYQFTYDSYGEIQSVTLPTGGVINYGWSNYADSYQNINRWLSQSTIAGSTTTYTPSVITQCSSNGTGCQERVNLHRPSGDETVYTMTLNNGAWDTNTTIYSGPASANQAKLATVTTYDFSQPCTTPGCSGAQNVTKTYETDALPDANLTSQTQTVYASPQNGHMTALKQWDFYATGSTPSSLPARQTNYSYTNFDLTSETHLDASGNTAASTTYNFTNTATPTSSVVGHGTANSGGPYLTSVVASNNAPAGTVTTSSTYEDTGSLLTATDANLNPPTTYKYDPTHTFVVEVDEPSTTTNGTAFSHVSKASFDKNSGVILTSDDENSVAKGQAYTVRYTYESVAGRPQKVTYPDGGSTSYAYPSHTEVDTTVAQTSSVSTTTATIVDGYNRPYQTQSGGITTTQSYDANGRPYSVTNPQAATSSSTDGTTYTYYDGLDRVSSVVNPDGSKRTLLIVGNAAVSTDEVGFQNRQLFNAFGELTTVFEPDPGSGTLTLETDYQRDSLGNVTCVEQHGSVAGTGCNSPATSDATSAWRVRRFFYNQLSQLRAASIPEHAIPSSSARQNCGAGTGAVQWTDCYFYDANGNTKSTVDNRGVTRTYTFDVLNRPLLKTSPKGTTVDLSYDAGPPTSNTVGRLWHESNDSNAASTYAYDTMGRMTSESSCRPSNCFGTGYVTTGATYDLLGNRTSITYPDGRVVANGYDSLSRLSSVTYKSWGAQPVGFTYWTAAAYTPPGELATSNYSNGMQMQAGFNARQSVTSLSYKSTSQTFFNKTYQWDKNATNLLNENDQTSAKARQYGYDRMNRLTSAVDVTATAAKATGTATITGFEGSYQDCSGGLGRTPSSSVQPEASLPPGGKCITVWDTGYVSITVGSFAVSAPYQKLSTSAKLASSLGALLNGSGSPVTATVSGSTITLTAIASGASANYALSYSSDGDFDVTFSGATLVGGSTATPIAGGLNQQYKIDAWGNLTSMGSSGFNQLSNLANQVSAYTYDAAGRLLGDGTFTYTYDDDGMLLSSSNGATYVYDALQARAQVTQGGTSKEYYYFAGQLIATQNPANAAWTDMIYAGGRIAEVAGTQTATPVYSVLDHLGSEVAALDSNGNVISRLDYAPFGQQLSGSNPDSFIFTGLEHDASGLDHATFRQYSSSSARWTIPDPYDGSMQFGNPQTLNRYAYVGNRPLAFSDPSGLTPLGCGFSTAADGGGIVFSGGLALADIGADIGLAECIFSGIEDILHLFQRPKFKGSLRPRPGARIWDEHGSFSPKAAGINDLLGLPKGGCEFGVCGGGMGFGPGGSGTIQTSVGLLNDGIFTYVGLLEELGSLRNPYRLFGTRWCGPGGSGGTTSNVDSACRAHDLCYTAHGLSFLPNLGIGSFDGAQTQAARGCNQILYNAVQMHPNEHGSQAIQLWLTHGVGVGILAPGTSVTP